jgi:phage FluMu gp28-like protein
LSGSVWKKIDRKIEKIQGERKKKQIGKGPLIDCDNLQFFRDVTGFEPTDYQVRFLQDKSQFVVARWARQTGKSLTLGILALYTALSGSGRSVAILAPSLRQGRLLIHRVSGFLRKLPRDWIEGRVLKTRLSFVNGSSIEAFPNSPETVRGLTLDVLIMDEANYIEDDKALYDSVVYALASTDGRFIATSTPGTRDSLFYEMFTNDEEYGDFSRHHVSFHDALEPKGPLKKSIVEKLRQQTREEPSRWDREMLAEFSSDEEAWLSYGLIESCVDESLEFVPDLDRPEPEKKQE